MPVQFHPHNPIDVLDKIIVKEDGKPLEGEIAVYKKLYNDLSASEISWDVWHDLKLPVHSAESNYYNKTSGQIDFVVLCEEGVLVLENKGGFVSTRGNQFFYGKSFGKKMKQNPFKQAEGYKYTLKNLILNNVGGCFFCEAVVFPHVNYPFESKIFDSNLLWTSYKSKDYSNSIENFILSVFKYTKRKHKQHFRSYPKLTEQVKTAIKKVLNPIIEDKNILNRIDTLAWLQIENIEILDGLYKNQRIMIEGPPGSGKTTMSKAFIDKQYGKRGIYLCWNNLLMHHMQNVLKDRISYERIEITTFFRFFQNLSQDISYEEIVAFDEGQFYQFVRSAIEKAEESDAIIQYDYIIVDEAQDVFDRGLDLFINSYCGYGKRGLNNGCALVLFDIDQSYSSSGRNVSELADLISEYFAHFKLDEIKRSAQNPDIRKLSSKVLEFPNIFSSNNFRTEFENVTVIRHKSLAEIKNHIVKTVLTPIRLRSSSLKGADCVVLIESSLLRGTYQGNPDMDYELTIKDIEAVTPENISDTANKLRYTSILKYKGMEKKNVFLIVTNPNESNIYELYVGITRAIYNLEINILE